MAMRSWAEWRGTALGIMALTAALLPAGCSSGGPQIKGERSLTYTDFAPSRGEGSPKAGGPVSAATPGSGLDINAPGREGVGAVEIMGPVGAREGIGQVAGTPGAPAASGAPAAPMGPSVLVDGKIGEINGKPIYISTFFDEGTPTQEPIGRTLQEKARELPPQKWLEEAAKLIVDRLDLIIRDELLRAEAYANLPPEKRQGLFAYLEDMQEEARRRSGGSREAYRRQLEEEGLTPEQMLKLRQQGALIYVELQQKVERRVNVTARDIAQAYNGRFSERYQHPTRYAFRLVMCPADASEAIAQINAEIASGRPFGQIATLSANRYKRDDDPAKAGLELREIRDPAAVGEVFAASALNEAAAELVRQGTAGQTRGPIQLGTANVGWLHLEGITPPLNQYQAQLEIEDALLRERREATQQRYLTRLQGRASVTSIPQMRERLLRVAIERYQPGSRMPEPPRPPQAP